MRNFYFLVLWAGSLLFLFCSELYAHPVSYQGSLGMMGYFSKEMTDIEMNYSAKHWLAFSGRILRITPDTDRPDVTVGGLNLLLKRWNASGFQANIYTQLAAGNSRLSGRNRAAYLTELVGDIEDRHFYFYSHFSHLRNSEKQEMNHMEIRGGFTPYVGKFSDLHTWVILAATKQSIQDTKWRLTPFLRFFYQNVLWEIGSSLQGNIKFNTIIHI